MKTITFAVFASLVISTCHVAFASEPADVSGYMHNVEVEEGARLLAELTGKTVVVCSHVSGFLFNWEGHNLTRSQAIRQVESSFCGRSPCGLVNINDKYYKVVPLSQTNSPVETPHIDILIRNQSISVENQPVTLDRLAERVGQHMNADTEVWVIGAWTRVDENGRRPDQTETNDHVRFESILSALRTAKVSPENIYIVCQPRSKDLQADTSPN